MTWLEIVSVIFMMYAAAALTFLLFRAPKGGGIYLRKTSKEEKK